jgi:hypothetical protein
MQPDPFSSLIHSRKFIVMLFDFLVSIVLYFGSKYAPPSAFEDIKFLIGALQVPVGVIIASIASEDNAMTHATAITDAATTAARATVGIVPGPTIDPEVGKTPA